MKGWLTPVAAFAAFCFALRLRRIRKMTPMAMAPRMASPATTPPTMAPVFDFLAVVDAAVGVPVADCALLTVLLSVVVLASVVDSTVESAVVEDSSAELVREERATSDRAVVVVPSVAVRSTVIVKPSDAQPYSVITVRSE
jgi:hypothetical protein